MHSSRMRTTRLSTGLTALNGGMVLGGTALRGYGPGGMALTPFGQNDTFYVLNLIFRNSNC